MFTFFFFNVFCNNHLFLSPYVNTITDYACCLIDDSMYLSQQAFSSEIWILYRGKAHMNRTLTVCQTVFSLLSPKSFGRGKERQLFIYLSFFWRFIWTCLTFKMHINSLYANWNEKINKMKWLKPFALVFLIIY